MGCLGVVTPLVLALALPLRVLEAAKLPGIVGASQEAAAALEGEGKWWARVGDHLYHSPDEASGLSRDAKNYYYAIGSDSALTDELRSHRVGGDGRWHVFHLPQGPSMLQTVQYYSDRRASISSFTQLKHGLTLSKEFPQYVLKDAYVYPLSEEQLNVEKAAVARITPEVFNSYLEKVTSLNSRSYEDPEASHAAVALLKKEFHGMGFQTCLQKFTSGSSEMVNVIAYAPGASSDSMVVGAHYDSRPYTGAAPGADDNGSGVAGMLAMAKAFRDAKLSTNKSVYFVGFAGEEGGLIGSNAFADALADDGEGVPDDCKSNSASFIQLRGRRKASIRNSKRKMMGVQAAIVMDEIGWVSPNYQNADGTVRPTVNLESYDWNKEMLDHMVSSCQDHNGDALFVTHSDKPFGSDHMSFLKHKMMSVLTINGDDEAYPHYHKSSDTIDQVTPAYGAMISKMNMGTLVRMSGLV